MSTPIQKLQEEFNTAMSVHEEQHIRYLDCQQRGDLSGEQRRLNAIKESGIRAIESKHPFQILRALRTLL